jgi:hemolysin activation/secretion protein
VAVDLYAGRGSATQFAGLRVEGEARLDPATGRWDSMVGSGRLAWYLKPASAHVVVASAEFGGARRQRVPLQLMLGDPQGGVRGYGDSRSSGAVRAVFRLEERWTIGGPTEHGAFGLSTFGDVGRVWAGDAPFGTDTRTKVGLGLGLLATFPPESPRLWRLDVAVPVSSDPHAGWEIRLTSSWTRSFWSEPDDVAKGRAGTAPSTIFGWP